MVEKGEIENDNKIPFLIHLIGKNLKAQYQILARIQRNRKFEILLERVYFETTILARPSKVKDVCTLESRNSAARYPP